MPTSPGPSTTPNAPIQTNVPIPITQSPSSPIAGNGTENNCNGLELLSSVCAEDAYSPSIQIYDNGLASQAPVPTSPQPSHKHPHAIITYLPLLCFRNELVKRGNAQQKLVLTLKKSMICLSVSYTCINPHEKLICAWNTIQNATQAHTTSKSSHLPKVTLT